MHANPRYEFSQCVCVCMCVAAKDKASQKHFEMTTKAERSHHIHVNFQFTLAGLSVLFDVFVHKQIERHILEKATGT